MYVWTIVSGWVDSLPSFCLLPVQSSLALHSVGLLVTDHLSVTDLPVVVEPGSAVSVTAGLSVPVVPPLPTAIPPPGSASSLSTVVFD
jgi:hypothetical protein